MSRLILARKSVKLFIFFTLAFIVSFGMIRPFQIVNAQNQDQNQYYFPTFAWDYNGNHWVWNLTIPAQLYDAYGSVPDSMRTQYALSDFGFFTTTQDSYLQILAQKINETTTQMGYNSLDQVNFALAFVQSIPYKTDVNSTGFQDYPRFPVETLVDNVGDCKSHSVLFATLTLMLGYGAVYINPPDHLAVGILGNNLSGTFWNYNNQTYYYSETTGSGFTVGQLPDQFSGVTAYVYPIDTSEQYVPDFQGPRYYEPNPTMAPYAPTPTTIGGPNPTSGAVSLPTIQPVQPLSVNVIYDNPVFFIIIILAIAISIVATLKTRKSSSEPQVCLDEKEAEEPNVAQQTTTAQEHKFCVYCGATNKSFAVYCEKCGKKIG
jgi:hypothetical protein